MNRRRGKKKKEIGLVAVLVSPSSLYCHTYTKKTCYFQKASRSENIMMCSKFFNIVWKEFGAISLRKSSLMHEKFTSKQKRKERIEVTLLHNPVKCALSEWCYCDFVDPSHQKHSRDLKTCLCFLQQSSNGLIWKTNCLLISMTWY